MSAKQSSPPKKPALSLDKKASPAVASTAKSKSSNSKNSKLFLVLLVFVIFLGTATSLGWLGYQQVINLQKQLAERPTHQQLKTQLTQLTAINGLKEQQQSLQKALHQQQLKLNHQETNLTSLQQALLASNDPKPRDWQLAEVEYLLRLANQRLQLEGDVKGALTLFKTAEQRLKQANVPGALSVRGHLLEDIEELKALPQIDRISIALNLQALADKALTLQVQGLTDAPSLNLDQVIQFNAEMRWYQHLWQEIRSLVVVRQRELPIEALPFTNDELALRHQLSALLLQASWAALSSEQPLYDASLAAAAKRLSGFNADQPSVADFNQQLNKLAQQAVQQKLPTTETSLDSLQAFIAQRYPMQLPLTSEAIQSTEQP